MSKNAIIPWVIPLVNCGAAHFGDLIDRAKYKKPNRRRKQQFNLCEASNNWTTDGRTDEWLMGVCKFDRSTSPFNLIIFWESVALLLEAGRHRCVVCGALLLSANRSASVNCRLGWYYFRWSKMLQKWSILNGLRRRRLGGYGKSYCFINQIRWVICILGQFMSGRHVNRLPTCSWIAEVHGVL